MTIPTERWRHRFSEMADRSLITLASVELSVQLPVDQAVWFFASPTCSTVCKHCRIKPLSELVWLLPPPPFDLRKCTGISICLHPNAHDCFLQH